MAHERDSLCRANEARKARNVKGDCTRRNPGGSG
ncbi:hypothetical protein TRIHO_29970 [Tritonibacter horizontis]|uniref:Uncharacterized protein n=1 Tax=Tritonibacter horizontis TaxID=1768241 RepID=A0A132BUY5_9RHOB|nr:hypothetical protein TRIHO_29970 [Tritonibacter horizontis]